MRTRGPTHLIQVGLYRGLARERWTGHVADRPGPRHRGRLPRSTHRSSRRSASAFFHDQTFDPSRAARSCPGPGTSAMAGPRSSRFRRHRYLAPGDYDDDARGRRWRMAGPTRLTRTITVHPFCGGPVVADFAHGPSEPFAGQEDVLPRHCPSTRPACGFVDWQWSFDDGGTAIGSNPSHAFATVGEHDVTLTVTTEDGRTGSTTKSVTVLDTPGSVRRLRVLPTARDDCRPGDLLRPGERPDRTARCRVVVVIRRRQHLDRRVAEPSVRRGRRLHRRADDHHR